MSAWSTRTGSSLAEEIQRALPDTRVVKTPTRSARRLAAALLTDLGRRPEWIIDLGDLATARVTEAFVLLARPLGPVPFGPPVAR